MRKEDFTRSLYKLQKLKDAAVAVATGPTGLSPEQKHVKQYIDEYKSRVDLKKENLFNPNEENIRQSFRETITELVSSGKFDPNDWNRVPWGTKRKIHLDRLAGTVISFSDDHQNIIAREFFPVDIMLEFLQRIVSQYLSSGKKLNIIDQFTIALSLSDNNPIGATLLAHSAYRTAGRVLDTRVSDRLRLPVASTTEPLSMVRVAESTAHFRENASNTDPLGDTYHWWGQLAAGMVFQLYRPSKPTQSRIYEGVFYYGPHLMKLARETIMGKTMIAGDHKKIDRQGLRVGRELGKLIESKLTTK